MKTDYLIIDGNHTLHRTLRSNNFDDMYSGEVFTGGVFGVLKTLKKVIEKFRPKKCIYVWDGGLSKRRLSIYPEYKAKRSDIDTEYKEMFYDQINRLNEILPKLGIHVIQLKYKEGDDVCYQIVNYFEGNKVLVTSDLDYVMMVAEDTCLYQPIKDNFITHKNCKAITGFTQYEYLFYKALKGDSSDNIKGVDGIGEKTIRGLLDRINSPLVCECLSESLYSLLHATCSLKLSGRESKIKEDIFTIDRNRKLMDFVEEIFGSEELRDIYSEVEKEYKINRHFLLNEFKKMEYNSILDEFDYWVQSFEGLK